MTSDTAPHSNGSGTAVSSEVVYKICARSEWTAAQASGSYPGSSDDRRDGFIHLSARDQLAGTAAKHFHGQPNLVLIAIDASQLGEALIWEPSRGGALFPHLYGPLETAAALWVRDLHLDPAGVPRVPEDIT